MIILTIHCIIDKYVNISNALAEPAASNNMPQGRGQGPPGNGQGPPGSGQGPPPGRKKRQNQEMVVCRNEDSKFEFHTSPDGTTRQHSINFLSAVNLRRCPAVRLRVWHDVQRM